MTAPVARLDLRAYACPLTWVKTRIALERLPVGGRLELWLREGEPVESVPRSAEEDGHRVLSVEAIPGEPPGAYRVLVEKGAAPAAALP
ncbi:sulfurtransferase TusA family protein [Anaeromyxobacter oryzisoli]|uniref:sulfurtransferase TusA family protein n=1 Tax=Anaeromyxobacter oryzisoli TaxID=2925408 RepID=UPI001F58ADB8|nr:sulfurtransferase TusA family protein [Anaeromyxobacter sp. SG63]